MPRIRRQNLPPTSLEHLQDRVRLREISGDDLILLYSSRRNCQRIEQQVANSEFDRPIGRHEFGLHNLLHKLKASVEGDFAPDAGEVPGVFVVAAKAPQVQNDAIHPSQFCCSIPTVASILHGFCPS